MLFRSIRFFFLIFSLAFSSSLLAQDNYQQWVDDITARLDKTSQLIQQGNTDDARTEVQMAYFEVFENLEGPIRINFSAQKSYQMEATFGEIRKMIGEGSSQKCWNFRKIKMPPKMATLSHNYGRNVGNKRTSRIDGASVNNMTKRSMPIPSPPVGGMPYSNTST